MKKENLLIITILITSLLIGSRLVYQKVVPASSKRDSAPLLPVNTQKSLGPQKKLAISNKVRPQFNKTTTDKRTRKIVAKQVLAQERMPTVAINENSNLKAENRNQVAKKQEIFNYVSEVRHRLDKQDEFLKLKVGLNHEQIKMVHTKNLMFQKQIEFANSLAVKKLPSAHRIKLMILAEHSDWMTYVLGAENFAEYSQMAPTSRASSTNEI